MYIELAKEQIELLFDYTHGGGKVDPTFVALHAEMIRVYATMAIANGEMMMGRSGKSEAIRMDCAG